MAFKKLGRLICTVALSGAALCLPFVTTGCNTDHPEAKITVQYADAEGNLVDYVLHYKMYRNMYPQTVQHFIELADQGFYDNSFVHDLNSSDAKWYVGGYKFITKKNDTYEKAEKAYLDAYKDLDDLYDYVDSAVKEAEERYDKLADPDRGIITPSVYTDYIGGEYKNPLTTLIGEFKNNQHEIENGELTRSFGCLSMYYTPKVDSKVKDYLGGKTTEVWLDDYGSPAGVKGTYERNSATCIFGIQTGTSTSTSPDYCIFGKLLNDDVLTDLKKAVGTTYKSREFNVDSKIGSTSNAVTYKIPSKPILIKQVKITKY